MRLRFSLLLILAWYNVFSQDSEGLLLRIIDANICFNKKTSALNFSYYFENRSEKDMVVIDYYEPCPWEKIKQADDTSYNPGLVLIIKDDSGKIVLPTFVIDTVAKLQHEQYFQDSSSYFEDYNASRNKNYIFHTRSLRKYDVLMNLYNLKMNKRKCFYKSVFNFDYSRKYTISLHYVSREDVHDLVNYSVLSKTDVIFVGELTSNEVNLCFK